MTKGIIVLTSLVFACVAEAKSNSCDIDAVYQVVTNRLLVQTRVSDAVKYAEHLERRNGVSREVLADALERAIKELHTDEETSYRANLRWMAVRLFSELAPQPKIEMLARLAETESNYCARTAFEGYYRRRTDSEGLALAARLLERHKSPEVMRGAVWSVLSEEAEHELTEERQTQLRAFALPGRAVSQPVGVSCWIVGTEQGGAPRSLTSISNDVQSLNRFFRQVAMSFVIESVIQTNDTRLSNVRYNDDSRIDELCDMARGAVGLKLFYVSSIDEVAAFRYGDDCIILGPGSNERTLAHEMGHLCGLRDIYDWNVDTELSVEGPPAKNRMPYDWGRYKSAEDHAAVVRRLLMYGYTDNDKADISYGDVYGVWCSTTNRLDSGTNVEEKVWHLSPAPVGFHFHGKHTLP